MRVDANFSLFTYSNVQFQNEIKAEFELKSDFPLKSNGHHQFSPAHLQFRLYLDLELDEIIA